MGKAKQKKILVKQNGYIKDPLALTWSEGYSEQFDKVWSYTPTPLRNVIVFFSVFALGISINGNWVVLAVNIAKQCGYLKSFNMSNINSMEWSLESLRLKNLGSFVLYSGIVSYGIYFTIGGFLHWYYYVRQRDKAEDWKCQPNKWLPPDLERNEIFMGSVTLFCNSTMSAILGCYISNGGYSTLYYDFFEYGWLWLILQWPAVFIFQDYLTYWIHRFYHIPFFYKHFHKLHHKYKQPTAFSVTALHPIECMHIQIMTAFLPLYVVPIHWFPYYSMLMYIYYHGIIDHSGINFKSFWWQPWQPDAIFHDNHHQYFHVNFSFNISYWDKLHGTYRQKDRVYSEEIFYGKGKAIDEVSEKQLKDDIKERNSENPLAYRDNKLKYKLNDDDLKKLKSKKKKKSNWF